MKIFRAKWKERLYEFPYELEHFCIVCAKNKEQAKDVILDGNPEIRDLKVSEIHTDLPCIIFHHFVEVELYDYNTNNPFSNNSCSSNICSQS